VKPHIREGLFLREGIGYCIHREVDMVVGGPWWCKLWAPDKATEAARQAG
jgi:hypothetical protein